MKFTLATLATAVVVAAVPIQIAVYDSLGVQTGSVIVQNSGLKAYAYVGSPAATLDLRPDNSIYYTQGSGAPMALSYSQLTKGNYIYNFAPSNPALPISWGLGFGDYTSIGGFQYWACTNMNEPGSLSNLIPLIVGTQWTGTAPSANCKSITLMVPNKQISSSSSSASTRASSASSKAPVTTAWANRTITSYTTYCPLPTVVTITTCDTVCYPKAVTVSTATTITCANCVVPTTTVVLTSTKAAVSTSAKPSTVVSSAKPSTVVSSAKPSTVASTSIKSLTVVNGGAKNAMGAMGIAGVAALLL